MNKKKQSSVIKIEEQQSIENENILMELIREENQEL